MKHIDKDNAIIGYKGFDKNLCCRNKQYEVGKGYHEDQVSICSCGMHFVTDPLDLFACYPPSEGNRFCIIEAWGDVDSKKYNSKHCASDLFIVRELTLVELAEEIVIYRDTHLKNDLKNTDDALLAYTTGRHSSASNISDRSSASNTGDGSSASNTGDYSSASNRGFRSYVGNSGDYSSASNGSGGSLACNTGNCSLACNTGYFSLASNIGNCSLACNTGYFSSASNIGDFSSAVNTGDDSLASSTGNRSSACNTGEESVAAVFGQDSYAKGALGCWLVLTERDDDWHIVGMKCVKVDGETIKADTLYQLKGGEVKECKE